MPTEISLDQAFGADAFVPDLQFAPRNKKKDTFHLDDGLESPAGIPQAGKEFATAVDNIIKPFGATITSTTGGRHNVGSLHASGRAVDIGMGASANDDIRANADKIMADLRRQGYIVRDERTRPKGQKVWGGPHIHVELPEGGGAGGTGSSASSDANFSNVNGSARGGGTDEISLEDAFGKDAFTGTKDKPLNQVGDDSQGIGDYLSDGADLVKGIIKDQFGPMKKGDSWHPMPKFILAGGQIGADAIVSGWDFIKRRLADKPGEYLGMPEYKVERTPEEIEAAIKEEKNAPWWLQPIGIDTNDPAYWNRRRQELRYATMRDPNPDRVAFLKNQRDRYNAEFGQPNPEAPGFLANIKNPMDALLNDSLPANALEAIMRAPEGERQKFLTARNTMLQEKIAANPDQYTPDQVKRAQAFIADRDAKRDSSIGDMWHDLRQAATDDPGRFGASLVNSIIADPELLLAPEGLGLRVLAGTRKIVTGVETTSKIIKTVDRAADAATLGAGLNLGIEAASAASEGRDLSSSEAKQAALFGGLTAGGLGGFLEVLSRGGTIASKLGKGKGTLSEEDLSAAINDAAKGDLAAEEIIRSPNPQRRFLEALGVKFDENASTRMQIEQATGIKFESDADLKAYLETARKEWKKLFASRDLNGQYQAALADERISRRQQLLGEDLDREVTEAAEAAKRQQVARAAVQSFQERKASLADDYTKALAERDAAKAAQEDSMWDREQALRDATDKLDQEDIIQAAFQDAPAVRRAMNGAAKRDAMLRTPKWQRGEIDPKVLMHLGVGSLFAGTAYALADPEDKPGAAFAAGLAGLILPKGGSILDRMRQSGAVSADGFITGLRSVRGELQEPHTDLTSQKVIIDRAKQGDQQAFKELYQAHASEVNRYVKKQIKGAAGRLGIDPEDIAQEVFIDAFKGIKNFSGDVPFGAYLYKIAKNKAIDAIRASSAAKAGEGKAFTSMYSAGHEFGDSARAGQITEGADSLVKSEVEAASATHESPEFEAQYQEDTNRLYGIISTLPDKQKKVFSLLNLENYDLREVAEMMGETYENVRKLSSRAEQTIVEKLSKDYSAKKAEPAVGEPVKRGRGRPRKVIDYEDILRNPHVIKIDGKPLQVYHGTPDYPIDKFSLDYLGKNTDNDNARTGIFWTDSYDFARMVAWEAAETGKKSQGVHEGYLELHNPKIIDVNTLTPDANGSYNDTITNLIKTAKKDGHDGAVIKNWNYEESLPHDEYVVFNPNSIIRKSLSGGYQRGFVDQKLLKIGALATLGAGAGAFLSDKNKELSAIYGAVFAPTVLLSKGWKPKLAAAIGAGLVGGLESGPEDNKLRSAMAVGGLAAAAVAMKGHIKRMRVSHPTYRPEGMLPQLDYLAGASSTRILNKAPSVFWRLMDHEKSLLYNVHQHLAKTHDFFTRLNKLPKQTQNILARALYTGNAKVIDNILKALGDEKLIQGYKNVRSSLDSLKDQLVAHKRFIPEDIEYFPRAVKDLDGLMKAIGKDRSSALESMLSEADTKMIRKRGTGLTDLERDALINNYLASERLGNPKPGFAHRRAIKEITPELLEFYHTPSESFHKYIATAVNDIERAKFFGKSIINIKDGNKQFTNVDKSVGSLMDDMLKEGKIKPDDVDEVGKILRSRFTNGERTPSEFQQAVKNMGYAGLLANPASALANLTDILMQFHLQGVAPTIKAMAKIATGRKFITAKEMGLVDHLAEEFTSTQGTVAFLNKMMKASGFSKFDILGKEVNMNAAYEKLARQSRTEGGIRQIQEKYSKFMQPDEVNELIKTLHKGERSDLLNQVIFAELSRSQPISRIEMPQAYLDHPDGRFMYQLKTFMLKQVDVVRRDAIDEMRKGNVVRGMKALGSLSILYAMSGMAQNEIRDLLYGRESTNSFKDLPFNMLKTFGWSKYVSDMMFGVSKEDAKDRRANGENVRAQPPQPLKALGNMAAPPWQMYEQIVTGDPKAIQYLPLGGRLLYERKRAKEAKKGGD
jgi:RNA polymerase sigma-70 factor (ECF subfamily)